MTAQAGDNTRERPSGLIDSEPFKRATTVCMRAVSGDHELDVVFGEDRPAIVLYACVQSRVIMSWMSSSVKTAPL